MIAVTCRNGEHFCIEPGAIERIETDPDVVVILVDGSKYVVANSFEDLLRDVRDHRATSVVAHERLVDGYASTPAAVRRGPQRSRDDVPFTLLPQSDED